jgi:hypothetical protein
MDITNGEAAVKPRESRWMIAYHFYAGMCVASATSVVFQRHSIRLGAIPVVVALAVGYLASRTLVRAIERSRLSRRAKTACKWMLFLAYLPVVILLAFVIGNATLGI